MACGPTCVMSRSERKSILFSLLPVGTEMPLPLPSHPFAAQTVKRKQWTWSVTPAAPRVSISLHRVMGVIARMRSPNAAAVSCLAKALVVSSSHCGRDASAAERLRPTTVPSSRRAAAACSLASCQRMDCSAGDSRRSHDMHLLKEALATARRLHESCRFARLYKS